MCERLKRRINTTAGFFGEPQKLLLTMTAGLLLWSSIFGAATAFAADYKIQQWQAVEIALTSSVAYTNPFQDIDVTATFKGPGNQSITRPAFWDGDLTWKVRFAPPQTGSWTMTTSATDSKNSGLHHVTKTIECDVYSGSLDIYSMGP